MPAMREARGLPRLNAIMRLWLQRAREVELRQACIYCAGAFEYDDRPGPVRDRLLEGVMRWRAALKRTVIQAIDAGHLRTDTEPDQLVFEMDALFTGLMRDARFLDDSRAADRAWTAWQRLLQASLGPGVAVESQGAGSTAAALRSPPIPMNAPNPGVLRFDRTSHGRAKWCGFPCIRR